jgi:hypothetical protein
MTAGDRDNEALNAPRIGETRASARDHLSDVPVRARLAANRVHVAASNAWYRAAGRRIHGARQGISNARNQRTLERGQRPRTTQAADVIRSSVPFYRNRISSATGRPNRMARELGRTADAGLARSAPRIRAERAERAARQVPAGSVRYPVPRNDAASRVIIRAKSARHIAEREEARIRRGRQPR